MTRVLFRHPEATERVADLNFPELSSIAKGLAAAGHSIAIGPPGSGKTTLLRLLAVDLTASHGSASVLCVTPSRDSATRLRRILALDHGGVTVGPLARSLGSLCFGIITEQALLAGRPAPELLTGARQDLLLAQAIERYLSANPATALPGGLTPEVMRLTGFRTELRNILQALAESGRDSDALQTLGAHPAQEKWQLAQKLLGHYFEIFNAEAIPLLDSSMLLVEATRYLRDSSLEISLPAHLLVDDAQELGSAAADFLRALAARGTVLKLFGDPDAAVLSFRGSRPVLMTQLARELGATEWALASSGGAVGLEGLLLRLASQIPTSLTAAARLALAERQPSPERPDGDVMPAGVEGWAFDEVTQEANWLAERLRQLRFDPAGEIPFHRMAIVTRSQQTLSQLDRLLAGEGVPTQLLGVSQPLRDEPVARALLEITRLALTGSKPGAQLAESILLSGLTSFDSIRLRRLKRALRAQELASGGARSSGELVAALFWSAELDWRLPSDIEKPIGRLQQNLRELTLDAEKGGAAHVLYQCYKRFEKEEIWAKQALDTGLHAQQANRNLDAVLALLAAATRFDERQKGGALQFVTDQLELAIPEDSLVRSDELPDAVVLATPSALIGRRYEVVALPMFLEGLWPNLRPRTGLLAAPELAEVLAGAASPGDGEPAPSSELVNELRMLYKAIGASNGRLLISATEREEDQMSSFVPKLFGTFLPSRDGSSPLTQSLRSTVGLLRRRLVSEIEPNNRLALAGGLARLQLARVEGANPESWYVLAKPSVEKALQHSALSISPTEVEAFLDCPLNWFAEKIGGTPTSLPGVIGSLIHSVMEGADELTQQALMDKLDLEWRTLEFENELEATQSREEVVERLRAGVQYLQGSSAAGARLLASERFVNSDFDGARLNGKFDRIELGADSSITVVDFKTGKVTNNPDEVAKHVQLGIYQLMVLAGALERLDPPLSTDPSGLPLAGAKLVFLSLDSKGRAKLIQAAQPSLEQTAELQVHFKDLLTKVIAEMGWHHQNFHAATSSHCRPSEGSQRATTCYSHLTRAVSDV